MTIDRYAPRWVEKYSIELPDVYFDPKATHTPIVSYSSLLIRISVVVRTTCIASNWISRRLFLNSPFTHV